ncbi:MAG: serine/threonine protein kinase [Nitrospirae bacterium]|nr:serine/threonine protein kinase [Nitrospirota bacterium]
MKIRDYELHDNPIGAGGMGCVYKAHHINLGVYRAIKELRTDTSAPVEMVRRFLQEARIQVQLKHPNIVEVFDCFEEAGRFYIVMEFIDGITLKALIGSYHKIKAHSDIFPGFEGVALDMDTCSDIISQALDALHYAHCHNTVHRDIKPANILLTRKADNSLHVKLADFGIAKFFHPDEEKLTKTGIALGTVHYMAPEQISPEDFGPFDHRADIYAMGVMVFELLTGTYPFGDRGTSEIKVLTNKIGDVMPNMLKYRDAIPDGYYDCISKAMKCNPSERFQDARQFKEAFLSLRHNIAASEATVEHTETQPISNNVSAPEQTSRMDVVSPDKSTLSLRQGNKKRNVISAVVLICIVVVLLCMIVYTQIAKNTPKAKTSSYVTPAGEEIIKRK